MVAPPGGQGTGDLAHLTLLGLLGFHDPPREGVTQAITECRRAGVKLAMITGDHPTTARRIADQIGLALPDSPVLVAGDLPDDIAVMGAMVDHDGVVLARADPEDKLRIAQALQARGHIVAMTGDGVNDAPALKMADIGIAMGLSGTEVAREAADLVLLDDHFATIVAAVRQGRETFLNVRRFLTYHLTDNVAELAPFLLWALSGGRFPLALGVMQILALDLGTDTLPATALGAERAGARVLDHPPVSGRLLDRTVAWRAFGILGPTEAVAEIAGVHSGTLGGGVEAGGVLPARLGPGRGLGRGVPHGGRDADGQLVRVPQHAPAGVAPAVDQQPVPDRGGGHVDRVRPHVPARGARRDGARAGVAARGGAPDDRPERPRAARGGCGVEEVVAPSSVTC